jgi:phosphatidylglycerophosphatase A
LKSHNSILSRSELFCRVWQDVRYFIAFGFGVGLSPIAPGTCGTVIGIFVYLLMSSFSMIPYIGLTIFLFALGVFVSERVTIDVGVPDYQGIVWDEVVGYLATMSLVPLSLKGMLLGFVLFRLFDIWKPWPIRFFDKRVPGGFGVMLDDVLAAIPAALILWLIHWSLPQ